MLLLLPIFYYGAQERAVWLVDHQPRAGLLIHHEELEFLTEFPMVAFFRFLKPGDITIELGLALKRRAVYPLEHPVLLVAAPVCPGYRKQLKDLDLAGRGNMRPSAKINKIRILVYRNFVIRYLLNELDLVRFDHLGK